MNRRDSDPVPVPGKRGKTTNIKFSQSVMPGRARGYVFFIILLGLPLIAYCAQVVTQLDTHNWLYLAGLHRLEQLSVVQNPPRERKTGFHYHQRQ